MQEGLQVYELASALSEVIFPAPEVSDEVIERKRCPYPGKRLGRTMNVSALKQMYDQWDELLDGIAFLTDAHARRAGRDTTTLDDWFTIGSMAGALPCYLVARNDAPLASDELPGAVLSMTRAAFDVTMTTKVMLARSSVTGEAARDPQRIAEVAEDASLFLNGELDVCAASPKHIEAFLRRMALPVPELRHVRMLGELLPDLPAFFAFCDPFTAIDGIVMLLRAEAIAGIRVIIASLPADTFADEIALLDSGLQGTTTSCAAAAIADLFIESEQRDRVVRRYAAALGCAGFADAVDRERELAQTTHATERLRSLASSSPLAGIAASALDAIARAVVDYLCLERASAEQMQALQIAANAALGRAPARATAALDIQRLMRTPSSVIELFTETRFQL